ncbi:MAG: hypothetical protein ACRDPD_20800 [Streptosporangiaceae bacterium]
MDAHDELLAAAVDITRAASSLAAQRFLEGVPVSKKADGTEVTPADVEVEEGTVLASNGHIHDALLDLVRDVPSGRDYQSLIKARR